MINKYKEFLALVRGAGYTEQINYAVYRFLRDQGVPAAQLNRMIKYFLRSLGYTGHLNEMLRDWENDGFPVSSNGPTILLPGSIDVSTFKIGTTQTITAGVAVATGGGVVTYEYRHLAVDVAVRSTSAAYAFTEVDDLNTGRCQWRAVETGGTNDGETAWQTLASGTVTYNAPTASSLVDQSFTEDNGIETYNAAAAYSVTGDADLSSITWSLPTTISGVTINSSGVVSFDTDTLAVQSGTSIVVRGTNSGGSVDRGFSLDITAAGAGVTASFGANTREGAGGVDVTGTSISSGDPSGHWQISGGKISPSATGEDSLSGTYNIVLNNAQTVDLTIDDANGYDFATGAELDTAIAHAHGSSTSTDWVFYAREGETITDGSGRILIGGETFDGTFSDPNSAATEATYNLAATASISGGSIRITCRTQYGADFGDSSLELTGTGPVIIENLRFVRTASEDGYNRDDGGPNTYTTPNATTRAIIVGVNGTFPTLSDIIIRDCRFGGTYVGASTARFCTMIDIQDADNAVIEDNEFDGFFVGAQMTDVVFGATRRNTFQNSLVDSIRMGFGATSTWVAHVSGNTSWDYVNDPTDWGGAHGDFIQTGSIGTSINGSILYTDNYCYLDADQTPNIYGEIRTAQGIYFDDYISPGTISGSVWKNFVSCPAPNGINIWRTDGSGGFKVHNNTLIRAENFSDTPFDTAGCRIANSETGSPDVWDNLASAFSIVAGTPNYVDNVVIDHDAEIGSNVYGTAFDGPLTWNASRSAWTFVLDNTSATTLRSDIDTIFNPVTLGDADNKGHLFNNPTPPVDTTAPTLSLPLASANGSDGATLISVSTDEDNGTLYWGIYPTASTPTAADVVAGTGATVNGSQSVTATGLQLVPDQTGLTASTAYKVHFVHDDAAANRSAVSTSSEFTTDAAASTFTGSTADPLYFNLSLDSGNIPSSTSAITVRLTQFDRKGTGGTIIGSTGFAFNFEYLTSGGGSTRFTVRASDNAYLFVNELLTDDIPDAPSDLIFVADLVEKKVWVTIDGVTQEAENAAFAGATTFSTSRYLTPLATSAGTVFPDYEVEEVEVWYSASSDPENGTVPAGAADWSVTGPQGTAEADPNAVTS